MPQPLKTPVPLYFGPGVVMKRPELAAHIANIANMWSQVETMQGLVLASMLRSEASLVISMFTSLSGAAAKNAVFQAVADEKLTLDQLKRLEKIIKDTKTAGSQRNDIVHGFWHIADQYTDALIWRDPRDAAGEYAEVISAASTQRPFDMTKLGRNTLIYKKRDFQDIEHKISAVLDRWQKFWSAIMPKSLPQ